VAEGFISQPFTLSQACTHVVCVQNLQLRLWHSAPRAVRPLQLRDRTVEEELFPRWGTWLTMWAMWLPEHGAEPWQHPLWGYLQPFGLAGSLFQLIIQMC